MKIGISKMPLLLAAAGSLLCLSAAEKPRTIGDPYGITGGMINYSLDIADQELDVIRKIGCGNTRVGILWNATVSPHGVWNMRASEKVLPMLKDSGVKPSLHFCGLVPGGEQIREKHTSQFVDFVTSYIRRYPGVADSVEILNEPDLVGIPAEESAVIFNAVADQVHKIAPGVPVVYGGNSGVPFEYIEKAFKAGAAEKMDAMSCHPYGWELTPEANLRGFMRQLRKLMAKYNAGNKPIWITEIGYSSEPAIDFVWWVFPKLFQEMGVPIRKARIISIHDPEYGYYTETHSAPIRYWRPDLKNVKYITFKELKTLAPQKNDVLMLSNTMSFPMVYLDALKAYLRKGGKVLSPAGIPFYFDLVKGKDGIIYSNQVNAKYIPELHIGWEAAWVKKGVPARQKAWQWAKGFDNTPLPKFHRTYYFFNADNLKPGDRFVPVLYGVSGDYKGASAGVYHFNSEFKGKFAVAGWSWRGCSETYQAYLLPRMFMMLLTEGVEKVFIHHLRSTWHIPAGIEAYFGIINRDMSWKPAAHAFAAFTKQMPAYSTRPVLTKKGDCYRADWRRPDGKKCAAFWRESTRTEKLPLEIKGKCVITNYLGVEEQVLPNGGKMDLSVGPGIVYLQYENAVNW